jgi:D-alanine-D-alanine ligase
VYEALDKTRYDIQRYDPKTDLPKLMADADRIDTALIILHGPFGEDGTVQGMLDLLGIPYQGSGVLGSALAMNKLVSKQLYEAVGLPVAPYMVVNGRGEHTVDPQMVADRLGFPVVIKPLSAGSSVGMSIVRSPQALPDAVAAALSFDTRVMIEAFIDGIEITAGVLGNDTLEALPLVKARDYALRAHQTLQCRGYSRTDMMVRDDRLYLLETNTIPGMTATSLFPQAARAAGYSFSALLDRLIELAMEDKLQESAS